MNNNYNVHVCYYEFVVFFRQNCSKCHLRAYKFQNFPGGGMPPDPPRLSCYTA